MNSYQDIKKAIRTVLDASTALAFMNKEQIFAYIASLVAITNDINDFMYELETKRSEIENRAVEEARMSGEKMTASKIETITKQSSIQIRAQKEWAENQAALVRDLRIAALAAQRSSE